jgi:hypothetical protein
MEKMEKVPGRKEKADQVPRHTRIEVFMRVLIENNTNGPVFRLSHTTREDSDPKTGEGKLFGQSETTSSLLDVKM